MFEYILINNQDYYYKFNNGIIIYYIYIIRLYKNIFYKLKKKYYLFDFLVFVGGLVNLMILNILIVVLVCNLLSFRYLYLVVFVFFFVIVFGFFFLLLI